MSFENQETDGGERTTEIPIQHARSRVLAWRGMYCLLCYRITLRFGFTSLVYGVVLQHRQCMYSNNCIGL